jgi:hypothetical protein
MLFVSLNAMLYGCALLNNRSWFDAGASLKYIDSNYVLAPEGFVYDSLLRPLGAGQHHTVQNKQASAVVTSSNVYFKVEATDVMYRRGDFKAFVISFDNCPWAGKAALVLNMSRHVLLTDDEGIVLSVGAGFSIPDALLWHIDNSGDAPVYTRTALFNQFIQYATEHSGFIPNDDEVFEPRATNLRVKAHNESVWNDCLCNFDEWRQAAAMLQVSVFDYTMVQWEYKLADEPAVEVVAAVKAWKDSLKILQQ